jgi:exodeoxyribonuclease VII large subunit
MSEKAISVSDLTLHIKGMVEELFPAMWVAGEISDLVRARSGHVYFTLKDDAAQIRAVMWRSSAERLKFDLEDGQAVLCFGNLEVYAPRGTYQLVVRKAQPQGIGALQLAFQKLQAKLAAEGLFASERKQPLPEFPRRIGIVTSPTGAAVRDFLQAAVNRFRGVEIVVIPALVQGQGAAKSIVAGIMAAHSMVPSLDVLVVSRGGGSLEDLWCFNEEPVVRAIAGSTLPIVSAVGHVIDVTLADLAADVRALTPTDAATHVLPDGERLLGAYQNLSQRLHRSMRGRVSDRQFRLDALANRPVFLRPHETIQQLRRELDEWDTRARRAAWTQFQQAKSIVAASAASLAALSPLNVLARGYSVTLNENDDAIHSVNEVHVGDRIETKLHEGTIQSTVDRVSR